MIGTNRVVAGVALLAGIAILVVLWRETPSGTVTDLPNLEGELDWSGTTFDPVQSELYVRASQALEEGDTKTSEALYREAISKYPDDPDGYTSLGACLYMQQRYEDAELEYERALRLDPNSAFAYYGLGCVAFDRDRTSDARSFLEKALALNDEDGLSHRLLGMVYEELGNRSRAISHYGRAIKLLHSTGDVAFLKQRLARLQQ